MNARGGGRQLWGGDTVLVQLDYYDHLLAVFNAEAGKRDCAFLREVSVQAQNSIARTERLETICTRCQSIVDSEKNSERMGTVVDFLFGRPIFKALGSVED